MGVHPEVVAGQRVRIVTTFRNPDTREFIDPPSPTVVFRMPGGVLTDPVAMVERNPDNPDDPAYVATYFIPIDAFGVWRYRVESAAPIESALEENFTVIQSQVIEPVT